MQLLTSNWVSSEVGEFFHVFKYLGGFRCDLLPRFSPESRGVYVDPVLTGERQLYSMELPW